MAFELGNTFFTSHPFVEMPMKKVERSGNSIKLPLRINVGQSFILKPNIIFGNAGNWNAHIFVPRKDCG